MGIALLAGSVALLVRASWRGSRAAWIIASLPAAILTWTIYERIRQTPPYPAIGVLGEMTAPTLSAGVVIAIVAAGWWRVGVARRSPRG